MSNLVKKITSAVAGLAVVFSIVSPIAGVSAAYTSLEAANKLATLGVIVDQSANPADYRLGDTISRREMAKVTMNLSGSDVTDSCQGSFSDLPSSDWGCKYAEAGLSEGFFAANSNFRADANISKWEALKNVMKARNIEKGTDADFRKAYVDAAVEAGVADSFSDYDTAATRGQIFIWAVEAVDLEEEDDDLLGDILGVLDEEEDEETIEEEETTNTVVSGSSTLTVSLSPETPDAATIPGGVNGLPVASFDFTAGSEDVTVNQITVKRRGLSDSDTLESIAVFTDLGRASNGKNDNQENDTEAQLNLSDGWVVVRAGETRTLNLVVDIPNLEGNGSKDVESDEFALEIVEVIASSSVEEEGSLVSNSFRIGSVDAPVLTFNSWSSVSNPKIGEEEVDIFEFEIKWDNDEDVILKSVTFEANGDAEDNLSNFKLYFNNDLVASTASMSDDYLTFDLGDGVTIGEDKTEDFTVKSDVIEGATETIGFNIDEELDITAESTKFGYWAAVNIDNVNSSNAFGTITIQAGELTIVEVESDFDEIREDKDNVVLGWFKVTNVAGQNLELQKFGVSVQLTSTGSAFVDVDNDGVKDTWETISAATVFEDVELYSHDTGSSYELTTSDTGLSAVFSESNIDVLLAQWTTEWSIRADTAEDIVDFDKVTFQVSFTTWNINATTWGFFVEETEDNKEVTDITPSSISFNTIDGSESGAKLSVVPLADVTVVRWADDIVALQFEVEAEESSDINIDDIVVLVQKDVDWTPAAATNQEISSVKLYKGSVSESNLLDQESGSNLGSGEASFDFDEVIVPANATETFIVTVSIVDGADSVTNSDYRVSLVSVKVEDDENDDVAPTPAANTIVSARKLEVTWFGILTASEDNNNEDNEDNKTILAWESETVFSIDVQATNESMDVETVTFTLNGITDADLKSVVKNASLYLDDDLIDTNTSADIWNGASTIVFDDLTNLIVEESNSELKLKLNTANIGYQKVGKTSTGITVSNVSLSNIEGVSSGKDASDVPLTLNPTNSKTISVVPGIIIPTLGTSLNSSTTPEITLEANFDNNTKNADNSSPNIEVTEIRLSNLGSTSWLTYTLSNVDDSWDSVTWVESSNVVTFDLSGTGMTSSNKTISSGNPETFKITITGTADGNTATLTLLENGVTYTVKDSDGSGSTNADSTALTTNLSEELNIWSRSY